MSRSLQTLRKTSGHRALLAAMVLSACALSVQVAWAEPDVYVIYSKQSRAERDQLVKALKRGYSVPTLVSE